MNYRSEIDGLRAIAVIPVILFHAGFELFSGGFVGVDVFFVISGYLITTILIEEIERKRFSIVGFYERRARRILPALFFVMLVCIPFAWMSMLPIQMNDFSQSLVAVSFFVSNILFWQESGYFAAAAEEKPLLHTWSLAVEEQYYVLFPIFLLLVWRFGKNRVFWCIVVMAAVSLLLSEWASRTNSAANFYLAHTRAWELFAGSIAAFIVHHKGVQKNEFLSLAGLAAILFAVIAYDEFTPFPSVYALVPVIGATMLILFADKETLAARFLSAKAFIGIGLISYSAYLWHQPLFAFARIKLPESPSYMTMLFLSAASIFIAAASYKYIETPFRKGFSVNRNYIFGGTLLIALFFVSVNYYAHEKNGFGSRFGISDTVFASLTKTDRSSECFGKNRIHTREDWLCNLGSDDVAPRYLVFGDSHALSFLPAIDAALQNMNESGYFAGTNGCTPFLAIHALRHDQNIKNCHKLNLRVLEFAKENNIDKVILVARWTYYTDGGYRGDDFSYIALSEDSDRAKDISRAAFATGLKKTIDAYNEIGVTPIIVPQIPQQRDEAIDLYAEASMSGGSLFDVSVTRNEHQILQRYVDSLFESVDVEIMDFTDNLCVSEVCILGTSDRSFYYDDNHLSLAGSALLVDPMVEFLNTYE